MNHPEVEPTPLSATIEAAGPESPAEPQAPVAIDVEADGTLGYASIQNAIPVVRSVSITK